MTVHVYREMGIVTLVDKQWGIHSTTSDVYLHKLVRNLKITNKSMTVKCYGVFHNQHFKIKIFIENVPHDFNDNGNISILMGLMYMSPL